MSKTVSSIPLDTAELLIKEKKYYSAFILLQKHDPDNSNLDAFILKCRLAVRYYAKSFMHQSFAFANLTQGQTLEDAREAAASIDIFDFQINKILDQFMTRFPEDARLHRVKGDYYFDVYRLYGNRWFLKADQIAGLSLEGYLKAINLNGGDAEVFDNIGVLYSIKNDFGSAEKFFTRAIAADKNFANPYYNLALLFFKQKKYDESLNRVKDAYALYAHPSFKADAAFLAAMALDEKKDYSGALAFAAEAEKLSPRNPVYLRGIIILGLKNKNYPEAQKSAEKLYAMNPDDLNLIRDIIAIYGSMGIYKEAIDLLDTFEKKYSGDIKACGNIYYARALFYSRFTFDKKKMSNAKSAAMKNYRKVYPPDHEIFILLERELNE